MTVKTLKVQSTYQRKQKSNYLSDYRPFKQTRWQSKAEKLHSRALKGPNLYERRKSYAKLVGGVLTMTET